MSAKDVRELHTKYAIYDECDCNPPDITLRSDTSKFHGGREPLHIEDTGWTCAEPTQLICRECDTDDGFTNEYTEDGKWPCDTLIALEKEPQETRPAKDIAEWLEFINGMILIAVMHVGQSEPVPKLVAVSDWLERLAKGEKQ